MTRMMPGQTPYTPEEQARLDELIGDAARAVDTVDPEELEAHARRWGPKPATAIALMNLMSAISEEAFCAGWMMGLEEALWKLIDKPDSGGNYGYHVVTAGERAQLRELSEACGGWIYWHPVDGETWMPLELWKARVDELAKLDCPKCGSRRATVCDRAVGHLDNHPTRLVCVACATKEI